MSKRIAITDKLELVETQNLSLTLSRLNSGEGGYTDLRWKRALYHALAMSGTSCGTQLTKIR
jgi:hypothetical protein